MPLHQLSVLMASCESVVKATLPASNLNTCVIIDIVVLVRAIGKPKMADTFGDLTDIIIQNICLYFNPECTRVAIVFNSYRTQSSKQKMGAHEKLLTYN